MVRSRFIVLSLAIVALAACQRHEAPPTGSYGDRVVTGQVVMASQMANSSPAGVEVSVVGTGMTSTLAADGRFTFAGVPDNAQITFRRADGINASVRAADANGVLELSTTGAQKTSAKHRGAVPNDPGPSQQIEGKITQVASDGSSITVHDSHGKDDQIALTTTTLIRKGDKVVKAADLAVGDQVHVKATTVNNVLTASQVVVQDEDDDNNNQQPKVQEIEGLVVKASATSITVHDSHGKDDVIAIDSKTVVRKGDTTVDPSTLQPGERVHVMATKASDGTLTATQIIVQDENPAVMSVEGTVKSVGTNSLVVTTEHNGDVTVNTDSNTVIRKGSQTIALSDIKAGDQVEAVGTTVDSTTMLAKMIHVSGSGDSHD